MNHKILKSVLAVFVAVLIFSGLSCDDRKASNIVEEEGLTLTFIKSQPVANGATVGEAIVGYAGVDNDLFYEDKTMMLFGDGKKMMTELVSSMKEL